MSFMQNKLPNGITEPQHPNGWPDPQQTNHEPNSHDSRTQTHHQPLLPTPQPPLFETVTHIG